MNHTLSSKWIALVIVFVTIFTIRITGYAQDRFDREILVYFISGVERSSVDQSAVVRSAAVQALLDRSGISRHQIRAAFPEFDKRDTLSITEEGEIIARPNLEKVFKIRVPEHIELTSIIEELKLLPDVLFAEPNGIAVPTVTPNDQFFSYQWPLQPGGGTGRIQAPEAWDIYKGNTNNIIAIIDGGIDATHPDLSEKVSGESGWGWDGHGIHVAGIAASKTNNTTGIAGVDWNAKLHSRRVDNTDDTGIHNAIVNAVNFSSNVHVLNNSWRLVDNQGNARYSTTIRIAFAYAYKQNRVAVASMGNEFQTGNPINYPAAFGHGIIAVGATNSSDVKATFSNTGSHIDVAAPGVSILSTFRNGINFSDPNYAYQNGTSMAAPHVSGIASLLKGYKSSLSNDDIERIIQLSADKVRPDLYTYDGSGWNINVGYGRVNARKALDRLMSPYVLTHFSQTGGTDMGASSSYQMAILGAPGLPDAVYIVKRHEVRKTVTFPNTTNPEIWCRGVATTGWLNENPNHAMGWCEVVVGTVTNTSATLRTYAYEVWNIAGQWIGWRPAAPANVTFAYTVLAPMTVSISGPVSLKWKEQGTWTANRTGGNGTYAYEWRFWDPALNQWSNVVSTSQQYTRKMPNHDLQLKVKVTSNGIAVEATRYVYLNDGTIAGVEIDPESVNLPASYKVYDNYPNPFNPSTTIRYELPEQSQVTLVIYDIMGREVRRLINETVEPGYHAAVWEARNINGDEVSTGIYIYRFTAMPVLGENSSNGLQTVGKMIYTK